MRIGAIFPQTEFGNDPHAIRDYAQAVEDMGYQHILVYDHVIGASKTARPDWSGPYTSDTSFHEPFVFFGYLAGVTRRVELVTGIIILPQRQTALVAKQAAEVDILSGGRLRLGVGVGWNPVEYEALNEDFSNRGKRIEEQVEALRALWSDTAITFEGKWHHIDAAGIKPLPVQRPIPIWFGANTLTDPILRRIARLGDGWFPQYSNPHKEQVRQALEQLRAYTSAAGRAPEKMGIEARLSISQAPRDSWADYADTWRDLGATHLGINTMGAGLTSPQAHIDMLRQVKETIGF